MSSADARVVIIDAIDSYIDDHLAQLECQLRADILATGPEDDAALDVPPDPAAPWRSLTVEEILMIERRRLEVLCRRDEVLEQFDGQ